MKTPSLRFLGLGISILLIFACGSNPTGPGVETTGSIRITSVPNGAQVFLDGADKGVTTDCTLTKVAPGSHAVKLVKAGYVDYQGTANVTAGAMATVNATLTTTPITLNVTVDYARVQPIPNPNGLDFPFLAWSTGANQLSTRGLTKVAEHTFTSPLIPLLTETVIRIWVIDDKMHNGTTQLVCRTITVNGYVLDVGTTIYGETSFIIGTNGVVRKP